ncbi:MAG: 16S rRNA (cytosine(1402)-N(4))-methyltransferase RsmH, partial [Pseudonocardiaceae bacterium]|nr:16S rRNA (cytosine(1402)-N(4))-methyltransferase RsmH [Pseudonocardiaceae bacterium]
MHRGVRVSEGTAAVVESGPGGPEGGALRHVPVLLRRCLDLIAPAVTAVDAPVAVDATLGAGGHAAALLDAHPRLRVIGLDRDRVALDLAAQRLRDHADRFHPVHAVYDGLPAVLQRLGIDEVQAVLFDLGVSSLQLDDAGRGFSYSRDAPLDMRMDQTSGPTAADVLNTYPVAELARVLREYGEERFAKRIAAAIDAQRRARPFDSSARLVELIYQAVPAAARRTGGHPAKRTFQALRVEVNAELDVLRAAVPAALGSLAVGGRLVALSYHSIEDRIVKRALRALATSRTPAGLPVELPGHGPQLRLLTRGAEQATPDEIESNPRAASVR